MMGCNHATMSAAAGILALPVIDLPTPTQKVAWVLVCAGMGLLPDWDQDGSHVSRMWGWPSRGAARVIGALAGGHRWGTHDIVLAPLVFAAVFAMAARHPVLQLLALAVSFGLAMRGVTAMRFGRVGVAANVVVSWGAAWAMVQQQQTDLVAWMPLAIVLGVASHIVGDLLTNEGVPLPIVWIWTRNRVALSLFKTNGIVERAVVAPALTLFTVWAIMQTTGYTSLDQVGRDAYLVITGLIPQLINVEGATPWA